MLKRRIDQWWQEHYGVQPLEQSQPQLSQWLATTAGQRLIAQEQAVVAKQLECVFGYHLLQLSMMPSVNLCQSSAINHHFQLTPSFDIAQQGTPLEHSNTASLSYGVTSYEKLPLPSDSVDVAIVHHLLEYYENPHQLLREASRVIIPHGHLLILGFNPISFSGLKSSAMKLCSRNVRWRQQPLRVSRVLDWLRLLDFEPVEVCYGVKPNSFSEKYLKNVSVAGNIYSILARKHVLPLTPIKPLWKQAKTLPAWRKKQPIPTAIQSHEKR